MVTKRLCIISKFTSPILKRNFKIFNPLYKPQALYRVHVEDFRKWSKRKAFRSGIKIKFLLPCAKGKADEALSLYVAQFHTHTHKKAR